MQKAYNDFHRAQGNKCGRQPGCAGGHERRPGGKISKAGVWAKVGEIGSVTATHYL